MEMIDGITIDSNLGMIYREATAVVPQWSRLWVINQKVRNLSLTDDSWAPKKGP